MSAACGLGPAWAPEAEWPARRAFSQAALALVLVCAALIGLWAAFAAPRAAPAPHLSWRAVDGDTVHVCATVEGLELCERIRLANVDAPELRDPARAAEATAARDALQARLDAAREIAIVDRQGGRSHGRLIARLELDGRDAMTLPASADARSVGCFVGPFIHPANNLLQTLAPPEGLEPPTP